MKLFSLKSKILSRIKDSELNSSAVVADGSIGKILINTSTEQKTEEVGKLLEALEEDNPEITVELNGEVKKNNAFDTEILVQTSQFEKAINYFFKFGEIISTQKDDDSLFIRFAAVTAATRAIVKGTKKGWKVSLSGRETTAEGVEKTVYVYFQAGLERKDILQVFGKFGKIEKYRLNSKNTGIYVRYMNVVFN